MRSLKSLVAVLNEGRRPAGIAWSAYAPTHDVRDLMRTVGAGMFGAGALISGVYLVASGSTTTEAVTLFAAVLTAFVATLVFPWKRFPRHLFLVGYWVGVAAITAGAFVLDQPAITAFMLEPFIFLTYFFWRERVILGTHLLFTAVAYAVPFLASVGDAQVGDLAVYLPIFLTVGCIVGVLSDRVRAARGRERARFKATIEALSTALSARDGYTGRHSFETLELVIAVCHRLELDESATDYVSDVALLHDIGKIGIPNEILNSDGRLNDEEWTVMRTHPEIGERIVTRVPGLEGVARAIRHEHERWDGTGYPDGLSEREIPLASRIVFACDAFHAMTSDRPYRDALNSATAREELIRNAGTQFDPTVVDALLHAVEPGSTSTAGARAARSAAIALASIKH